MRVKKLIKVAQFGLNIQKLMVSNIYLFVVGGERERKCVRGKGERGRVKILKQTPFKPTARSKARS